MAGNDQTPPRSRCAPAQFAYPASSTAAAQVLLYRTITSAAAVQANAAHAKATAEGLLQHVQHQLPGQPESGDGTAGAQEQHSGGEAQPAGSVQSNAAAAAAAAAGGALVAHLAGVRMDAPSNVSSLLEHALLSSAFNQAAGGTGGGSSSMASGLMQPPAAVAAMAPPAMPVAMLLGGGLGGAQHKHGGGGGGGPSSSSNSGDALASARPAAAYGSTLPPELQKLLREVSPGNSGGGLPQGAQTAPSDLTPPSQAPSHAAEGAAGRVEDGAAAAVTAAAATAHAPAEASALEAVAAANGEHGAAGSADEDEEALAEDNDMPFKKRRMLVP